jgi:hypothetical protein
LSSRAARISLSVCVLMKPFPEQNEVIRGKLNQFINSVIITILC